MVRRARLHYMWHLGQPGPLMPSGCLLLSNLRDLPAVSTGLKAQKKEMAIGSKFSSM